MVRIATHQLKNGLRLAAVSLKGTSFVDMAIAIRAGSRYEPALLSGITHFLEHILYRGSEKYPSVHALSDALESLGDGLEGGTSREYTLFTIQLPPENLKPALEILADWLQNPLLQELDTERGIIYEEILEELDENGDESDPENVSRKAMFGEHPLGRPILGRKDTLKKIKREQLERYFRDYYRPDNLVVSAAGAVDTKKFFEETTRVLGPLVNPKVTNLAAKFAWAEPFDQGPPTSPTSPTSKEELPSHVKGPLLEYITESNSQVEAYLSFVAFGENSDDFVAQMALERILDDGLSSRLQRKLCEQKGLLYDMGVSTESYTDIGVMDLSFRIREERLIAATEAILGELAILKAHLVEKDELDRVKGRMKREAMSLFENARFLSVRIAEKILLGLQTPFDFDDWKLRIDGLKPGDIQRVARKVFVPERAVAVFKGKVSREERRKIERALRQILK